MSGEWLFAICTGKKRRSRQKKVGQSKGINRGMACSELYLVCCGWTNCFRSREVGTGYIIAHTDATLWSLDSVDSEDGDGGHRRRVNSILICIFLKNLLNSKRIAQLS